MYKSISLLMLLVCGAVNAAGINDINCQENGKGYAMEVNGDHAKISMGGQTLMTWLSPKVAWDGHMSGSWSGTDLMVYFENHYGVLRNVRVIATIPSNDSLTGVMVINTFWSECNRNH
jgi:hypothetical protein